MTLGSMFFWGTLRASACAVLLFGFVGAAILRAMDLSPRRWMPGIWLVAPAVGMGIAAPLLLLAFAFCGCCVAATLSVFAAIVAISEFISRLHKANDGNEEPVIAGVPEIPWWKFCLIVAAAAAWAVLPSINIYPRTYHGAVYTSSITADHSKVAILDSIAREGLPLRNPYYAPMGDRVLLSYSYGWYVMGAAIKQLGRASGWQAEVAMTWYTSFAVASFLCALAIGLSGRAMAGMSVLLLMATGPMGDGLSFVLGGRWPLLTALRQHGLELPYLQLAWAPQHAFSALEVVLLLWLLSGVLSTPRIRYPWITVIGFVAAAGFESSTWVGCVALIASMPFLLVSLLITRVSWSDFLKLIKVLLPATILCAAVSVPILTALFSGPPGYHPARQPIALDHYPATRLEEYLGPKSMPAVLALNLLLFWFHLLPLQFGIVFLLGGVAIIIWRADDLSGQILRALALASSLGYFLVAEFIKSAIYNNDLGWRAVNIPGMFLSIWGAIALTELSARVLSNAGRWRTNWRAATFPSAALLASLILIALGLTAMVRAERAELAFEPKSRAERRLFAQQADAWQIVRRYTGPTDLVLSNPDGFQLLTSWPTNLPANLLADRPQAYSCVEYAKTYAFRYPYVDNVDQHHVTRLLFKANPRRDIIERVHDSLHVKAIVITPEDEVWATRAIDHSGLYRCVAATRAYRVYVAREIKKKQTL